MDIITQPGSAAEFPVDALPAKIGEYVRAAAESIGCDPAYVGLPMLVALAGAISNRRRIRIKDDWHELPVLWCAVVGGSGDGKSPARLMVLPFLNRKEWEAAERFSEAMEKYKRDRAEWEQEKSGDEPQEPICERFIVGDTTIEALALILSKQYNGVTVFCNELTAWLDGFNQYKKRGSDAPNWLNCWDSGDLVIDRKTGDYRTIRIRRASVPIFGPITPGELRRALSAQHLENGLAARMLFAMPEPRVRRFSESNIGAALTAEVHQIFDRLVDLQPGRDSSGNPEPLALTMTPDAQAVFIEYHDRLHAGIPDLDPVLRPTWAKMPGHVARFALIFQLASWAAGEQYASDSEVDEASMEAAVALAEWFCHEARRVYGALVESDEDREQCELIRLIRSKGGAVTARDIMRSRQRRYPTSGAAESALNELSRAGIGRWEHLPAGPKGGRPSSLFRLMPDDNTCANSDENGVASFVSSVNGSPALRDARHLKENHAPSENGRSMGAANIELLDAGYDQSSDETTW